MGLICKPSTELGAEAFEKSMSATVGANSHPHGMHAAGAMTDVCIAFLVFVDSTVSSAINVVNAQERTLGRGG